MLDWNCDKRAEYGHCVRYRQPRQRRRWAGHSKSQLDAGMRTCRRIVSMSTVVKIGGALLENAAKAVAAIQRAGTATTVIVHGGGIQITRMLERMKVASVFIEGLRVTDAETLAAVA